MARGPAILVLAAGAASRMRGADKLLMTVDGTALLTRIAAMACGTGQPVFVTLPPKAEARRAALAGLPVTTLTVEDASLGMSASLRTGARAIGAAQDGLMVVLADMPELEPSDFDTMLRHWMTGDRTRPLRATAQDGRPGQPVIFPRHLLADLATVSGDIGGRDLLRRSPPTLVALPGTRALTDLDTPEAWDEWRARTGR